MIDDETERAVAGWVKLGDQVTGRDAPDGTTACVRCGSRFRVLDRSDQALCARCYLEQGEPSTNEQSEPSATDEAERDAAPSGER